MIVVRIFVLTVLVGGVLFSGCSKTVPVDANIQQKNAKEALREL